MRKRRASVLRVPSYAAVARHSREQRLPTMPAPLASRRALTTLTGSVHICTAS
jgi:hypothetical protein